MSQAPAGWRACLAELRLGQFVMVMGWSGLYFCVDKLEQLWGLDCIASLAIAWIDGVLFLGLCLGAILRLLTAPQSLIKELREPLGLSASAAFAVAMVLFSRVLLTLANPERKLQLPFVGEETLRHEVFQNASELIWYAGAGLELVISLTVVVILVNSWRQKKAILSWVSPVMFIPAAGNVLVALAGVPLGHVTWSIAQFVLGLVLWPLVSCLLFLRIRKLGALPKMARPSWFIALSPPSVVGLSLLVFQAPSVWVWACWFLALVVLIKLLPILNEARQMPFSNGFWAFSFPLAAWCSLSISMATHAMALWGGNGGWGSTQPLASLALYVVHVGLGLLTMGVTLLLGWLSVQSLKRGLTALRNSLSQ